MLFIWLTTSSGTKTRTTRLITFNLNYLEEAGDCQLKSKLISIPKRLPTWIYCRNIPCKYGDLSYWDIDYIVTRAAIFGLYEINEDKIMTIIKTMEEFGRAVDAGKDIEILFHGEDEDTWETVSLSNQVDKIIDLVKDGSLRTSE